MTPTPVFPKIDTTLLKNNAVGSAGVAATEVSVVGAAGNAMDFSALSLTDVTLLITETGDKIRTLKGQKADKVIVKASVDKLLALKER